MTTRISHLTAFVLYALAICIVGNFVFGALAVDQPLDASSSGIKDALNQLHDNRGVFFTSLGFDVAGNVITFGLAAALFLLFGRRNRLLAGVGSLAFVATGILFLVNDVLLSVIGSLGNDVAHGVGNAETLQEVARVLAVASNFVTAIAITFVALGISCYGAIIGWAPTPASSDAGADTAPRWLGYVALVAGTLGALGGWLTLIDESLGLIGIVGLLLSLVFILVLATWLVRKPEPEAAGMGMVATA